MTPDIIRFATPRDYAAAVAEFLTPAARTRHYLDWLVIGEALELQLELEPLLRALYGDGDEPASPELRRKALHEAGDLLFALLVSDLVLEGDERLGTLDTAVALWYGHPTEFYPRPRRDLAALWDSVGAFASANGKEIREPHTAARRREDRSKAARCALETLAALLRAVGHTLADAADANHGKLADRAARGVICGDGSDR